MIFGRPARQELHAQNALETPPDRPRQTASRGQGELFESG
jgi:hypothetical protein